MEPGGVCPSAIRDRRGYGQLRPPSPTMPALTRAPGPSEAARPTWDALLRWVNTDPSERRSG